MEELNKFLEFPLISIGGTTLTVGKAIIVLLVICAAWVGYRILERIIVRRLERSAVGADKVHLFRRLFLIVAIVIAAMTAMELLNIPITAFAFVSGAIAIGIGFGAQNIINNFISGWILMWERPIRIGDFIELGDARGRVEAINTRSTRIRRVDGVHMLVPNSFLLENTVVNWTLVDQLARTTVCVGVAYGSPVKKVRELLLQVMDENELILDEPEPAVIFEDFGDNSLVFDAYFWIKAAADRDLRVIRSDVRFKIDELFAENGIVIAFPQRDIHFDSDQPLQIRMISPEQPNG